MAAFHQHMKFSTVCGIGYAGALYYLGHEVPHSLLAGGLCGLAGMLPDLDSDSGKPLREMVTLLSAVGALVCFHRLGTGNPDMRLLLSAATYFMLRIGLSFFLKRFSEHRGMFHSLPAMFIPALIVYLAWSRRNYADGVTLAGGVALGYFSHLLLDEIFAIDFRGLAIKANQFSGTAVKLYHPKNWTSTIVCWSILLFLSYRVATDAGWLPNYIPTIQELREMKRQYFSDFKMPPSTTREAGTASGSDSQQQRSSYEGNQEKKTVWFTGLR